MTMTETELCRLCAESKPKLVGIYDEEGEKNEIEKKIIKYLDLRVISSDILPLYVCTDCCSLLDQWDIFYEKSHEAQISLSQLFIEIKEVHIESNEPNINDVEKIIEYTSKTEDDIQNEEEDDDDYSGENVLNTSYLSEENENQEIYLEEELTDEKPEKIEKTPTKQKDKESKQRITRKKSNLNNLSCSDNEDTKIPDNYMTGTASDKEIIELETDDGEKQIKLRGKILERYPWLCTDCNEKFSSLELLENHHNVVHNQQAKYMCVQCCKVYDKYNGFLTHVKRHKSNSKFNCTDCGKSFINKKVFDSHKLTHSNERPHVCQTCGKTFRQQSALYIHSRCHLPETMKNRFPCDQCGKRFSTKPNLVTHKRIHSGVRNFTCDQCGKSFVQKGNLEAHFLTHSADKPYSCSQCSKAFKTPLQLKKHETVHTGAKPHQCAVCGRTFREKGTLREHHRIHTGAMPFTCEFCGKCFRFKGILTTHRRQHTGERPYSCLECQHHFTNWPNYNKHMKRRHGINTSQAKHLQRNQEEVSANAQEDDPEEENNTDITSQPIILQGVTTTNIQAFSESDSNAEGAFVREKNTTFINTVPTTMPHFLTPNVPYNFYSVSSNNEGETILPK